MTDDSQRLSVGSSSGLVWLCSMAPLGAVLLPLLLPVLEQTLKLGARDLALLASADLTGVCVATVSAPFWLARTGSRAGAAAGLAVLIVANTLGGFANDSGPFLIARLFSGVGTGLVFASAIPIVSKSLRPARLISAIQVLQLVLAAVALGAAGWAMTKIGVRSVLFGIVILAAISLPVVMLLPSHRERSDHRPPSFSEIRPGLAVLIAILIYFATAAILTNYAGKLGVEKGMTIGFLSSALAIGNLAALPGAAVALVTVRPLHRRIVLVVGAAILIVAILTLIYAPGGLAFAGGFFLIQFCIALTAPLQVAALVDQDESGRAIEGLAAAQSVGQAVGPLVVVSLIAHAGMTGAYMGGLLLAVVSTILIIRPRVGSATQRIANDP